MKKNIEKTIIGVVIISIIVVFILMMINNKQNSYKRPNYDYIATIYHSEVLGMDAGTEYVYYIYKSEKNDNKYFYIKSKSSVTIEGSSKGKDVDSGELNNKNDLKKITEDIEKDSREDSQTYIIYTYGNNEKLNSISELENKLFK